MMWKFINLLVLPCVLCGLIITGCKKTTSSNYSYHSSGFYYKLLSFNADSTDYRPGHVALVNAVFKTQSDSVFWDSFNDLNNRLFIKIDSTSTDAFKHFVSTCATSDSASLLIKTHRFFPDQFRTDSIPFFSKKDSVVKVNFKIKEIISPEDFEKLESDLRKEEQRRIMAFFQTDKALELAYDHAGFYWIERPEPTSGNAIEIGDLITIAYEGTFLNGRFLEKSEGNFEFIFGTPDQLLKGLNYVIGKLKVNQTAKILLSSRLAFGDSGSSNGIVPPCTPLIYKIKIIDVKKIK